MGWSTFRSAARLALLVGSAAFVTSCADKPLPGTMLGTYAVVGTSQTNTCGPLLSAPSPWDFTVQMSETESHLGTTLYWSWMNGTTPLSSILSSQSTASLTTSQEANVDTPPDAGLGPCTLSRSDDVEITLAAGSPPPAFMGVVTYDFTVTSGSVCTDQLSSSGGMYEALPCTLSYGISGMRQ
jgi:hypothetical protein